MNDQFINYEAESAQLTDKLTVTKGQLDALEQEHHHLKVVHCLQIFAVDTRCFLQVSYFYLVLNIYQVKV